MLTFKRLPKLCLALGLCSLPLGAIACDDAKSCTLIGWSHQSEVRLVKDAWELGEYELDVAYSQSGDASFRCSFALNDSVDTDAAADADAGETAVESSCVQLTGSQRSVDLSVENGVPTLHVRDAPESLRLTLRSGGETLFEDTIAPQYTESFPNGPGCGTRRTASTSIEIP